MYYRNKIMCSAHVVQLTHTHTHTFAFSNNPKTAAVYFVKFQIKDTCIIFFIKK